MSKLQNALIAILRFLLIGFDKPDKHRHENGKQSPPAELHGEQYY